MPDKFIAKLYLLPSGLAPENLDVYIPLIVKRELLKLQHFICEQEKPARQYLKSMGVMNLQAIQLYPIHENADEMELQEAFNKMKEGTNMGLLSDAGLPAIADPGAQVVKRAHEMKVRIIPLPGPSSIFQALMASGLNGQEFVFHGYLPRDKQSLKKRILTLEKDAQRSGYAQIFIETPYRNQQVIETLFSFVSSSTLLNISCNINSPDEFILTQTIKSWQRGNWDFHKKPCVFILGQG